MSVKRRMQVPLVLLAVSTVLYVGCGGRAPGTDKGTRGSDPSPVSTVGSGADSGPSITAVTLAGSPSTSSLLQGWHVPTAQVDKAFADLRRTLPGGILYVPTLVPPGTTLAASWWPVSTGKSVTTWSGPTQPNPLRLGTGEDWEVRVALRVGEGDRWLEILERIKGDLGDIQGQPAGTVGERPATAYRYHGGDLIQWSDEGAWYAVYGTGLPDGTALRVAHGMRGVEP